MPTLKFDTVLINGSVGAGKTTTAELLGEEIERLGIPGAVIDVDWLRRSWPAPAGDPFRSALALENMRAVAANFRRAGAGLMIVATVVETRDELDRATAALSASSLLHVRLTASPEAAHSRLAQRHNEDETALRWHIQRHPELVAILDRAGFTDELVIDTTDEPASAVAKEVLARVVR
jgi:adenylylsulfate kinase-like enzyme